MRSIIHLDLDAFFAQVEQVRLKLPADTPLVAVQWQGVIAVNYPARAFGITRFSTLKECKEKCPQLVSVHVPTLSKKDPVPRYRKENDYDRHKISLITYRNASAEIMKIVGSICKNIEVASVDEVFMDVTELVEDRLAQMQISENPKVDWEGVLMIGDHPGVTYGKDDLRLRIACDISAEIRSEIFNKLGYTSSCGIAHNKMLAKLVSSTNKPNKQTVIRQDSVLDYMSSIKYSKIRGLGGKLGLTVLKEFDVEIASQLWTFSLNDLQIRLGIDAGTWLYNICRGICNEQVRKRAAKNSIQSIKAFRRKLVVASDVFDWIYCFSHELYDRILEEFEKTHRWPKTMTISLRMQSLISRSGPFPRKGLVNSPRDIYDHCRKLIEEHKVVPISQLCISVQNLEKPVSSCIYNYFPTVSKNVALSSTSEQSKTLSSNESGSAKTEIINDSVFECPTCNLQISISEIETHQHTQETPIEISEDKTDLTKLLQAVDENGVLLYYKCLECSNILSRADRQEHQDRHLAMNLARQLESPIKKAVGKKRKKTIADFFSRVNKS